MPDKPSLLDILQKQEEKDKPSLVDILSGRAKDQAMQEDKPLLTPGELESDMQAAASSTRVDTGYKPQSAGVEDVIGGLTPAEDIKYLNDNPMTDEEAELYSVKANVRKWYSDRGGISPEDKLGMFISTMDRLQKYSEEKGLPQQVYDNILNKTAQDLGLKLKDGKISAYPHEVEQYSEQLVKEYNNMLSRKGKDEDPAVVEAIEFVRDAMIQPLGTGSERVLNTPVNVLAISEKIGNVLMGLGARGLQEAGVDVEFAPSKYFQERAQYRAVELEERRQSNDRYDSSILEYARRKEYGKALGATTASFMENLPLLTTLAAGGWAGAGNITLGAMGVGKGAEEYLKLDREEPEMSELMKTINSLGKMFSEIIWEGTGTMAIVNQVKKGIEREGADVIRRQLIDSYTPLFQQKLTRLMNNASPGVREMATEMATEYTDYTMDAAMGIYEGDLADRMVDAGLVGLISGQALTIPGLKGKRSRDQYKKLVSQYIDAIPVEYSPGVKAELVPLMMEEDRLKMQATMQPEESALKRSTELKRQKVTQDLDAVIAREEGIKRVH
jgi:hypothetical protein